MDKCHNITDKQLKKLENAIIEEYKEVEKRAKVELTKIIEELSKISLANENERMMLITKANKLRDAIEHIAYEINNVNNVAVNLLNKALPNFYGENAIFTRYEIEKAIGGVIKDLKVNQNRIYQYIKENPNVFKDIAVDNLLDLEQITRDTQRTIYQGVINGEGINKLYGRVKDVVGHNATTSLRIVRTEVGRIENLARTETRQQAIDLGFKLNKVWSSAIDMRTRKAHAVLQGESVPVDELFSNGLRYPCDPNGTARQVVNCRCTTNTEFMSYDKDKAEIELDETIKKLSYEKYKERWSDFKWQV